MSKDKNIRCLVATGIVSAIVCVSLWAVGFFTSDNAEIWKIVFYVAVGLLGATCIANLCVLVVMLCKQNQSDARKMHDYADNIRKKVQADIGKFRIKMVCSIIAAYVYLALVFGLVYFCAFAIGKARFGVEAVIIFLLLFFYINWGVLDVLFRPMLLEVDNGIAVISRKRFPLICQTTERAAAAVGYRGKIRLFLAGEQFSVTELHGCAYVVMGYKAAALFTREELYAVMLHEFAHISHKDVKNKVRLSNIQEKWDNSVAKINATYLARLLFFDGIARRLIFNIELYKLFSSIGKERAADVTVLRVDGGGKFADALAKTEMIVKYNDIPVPETEYYFFEPEKMPTNLATLEVRTFFKYCEKYGELWRDELINELPMQIDTHPTSRMRIQSFGGDPLRCNGCRRESDVMYVIEQQRIAELADEYIALFMKEDYAERRKILYLERKAAIDALDAAEQSGSDLNGSARKKSLLALIGIDDDRAIAVAERMIKDNDCAASAYLAMGRIYSRRHDDRCVECFRNAAVDPAYAANAYELIAQYALYTGKEELLDEYRKTIPEVVQNAQNKLKANVFTVKTPTLPCDLDMSVIAELADKCNAATDNAVAKLYVTKYVDPDGNPNYPVVIETDGRKSLDIRVWYSAYETIETIGGVHFVLCNPQARLMRKVKRAESVLVYDCTQNKRS